MLIGAHIHTYVCILVHRCAPINGTHSDGCIHVYTHLGTHTQRKTDVSSLHVITSTRVPVSGQCKLNPVSSLSCWKASFFQKVKLKTSEINCFHFSLFLTEKWTISAPAQTERLQECPFPEEPCLQWDAFRRRLPACRILPLWNSQQANVTTH